MVRDNIQKCKECGSVFEMPTRYVINKSPKNVSSEALCFIHITDPDVRKEVKDERLFYLKNKYKIYEPEVALKNYTESKITSLLKSKEKFAFNSFALESALAEFTYKTNREEAPYLIIGKINTNSNNPNKQNNQIYTFFKNNLLEEIFFSIYLENNNRIIAITKTDNLLEQAENLALKIEKELKNDDFLVFASFMSCNKKRDRNFLSKINNNFDVATKIYCNQKNKQRFIAL
ncbi:MAG: hypothetical protein QXG86_01205 [Candidatus Woesearchaeota archaeon]